MKNSDDSRHSNILPFKRVNTYSKSKDILDYESLINEMNMTELVEEVKYIGTKLNNESNNFNAIKGFSLLRRLQAEYVKINHSQSEEIDSFIKNFESLLSQREILQ